MLKSFMKAWPPENRVLQEKLDQGDLSTLRIRSIMYLIRKHTLYYAFVLNCLKSIVSQIRKRQG